MTQASMARSLREIANALESGPWVHQGVQSTHLMFVKIGIWEVQLHKGWKCHRRHSWLSQIQNTVLKADLSQAWAACDGRHQLQAFLTSQTNGFKAFHFPLTSQEAHSIIQGLQPHHGLVPELWSLSNITQRLADQNNRLQVLRVEILKNLLQDLCGTLRELVFWASQHFSHKKLGDESLHFLKDPRCYQSSPLSGALAIYLSHRAILSCEFHLYISRTN